MCWFFVLRPSCFSCVKRMLVVLEALLYFSGSRFLCCFRSKLSSSSIVLISDNFFCIAVVFSIKWVVDVLSTNKQTVPGLSQKRKKESKKTKVENREQSVCVCLLLLCLFCGFDEAASSSCCCYFQSWVIKICCWRFC